MKQGPFVVSVLTCALVAGCHGKGGGGGSGSSKRHGGDTQADPPIVDNTPPDHADIPSHPPKGCGSPAYSMHYGDALKTLREAEKYKATERTWYVRELSDYRNEYLEAGISPKFRDDWFGSHRTAEKDRHCMAGVFDAINDAAKKTLPKYRPRGYTHHEDDSLITDAREAEDSRRANPRGRRQLADVEYREAAQRPSARALQVRHGVGQDARPPTTATAASST